MDEEKARSERDPIWRTRPDQVEKHDAAYVFFFFFYSCWNDRFKQKLWWNVAQLNWRGSHWSCSSGRLHPHASADAPEFKGILSIPSLQAEISMATLKGPFIHTSGSDQLIAWIRVAHSRLSCVHVCQKNGGEDLVVPTSLGSLTWSRSESESSRAGQCPPIWSTIAIIKKKSKSCFVRPELGGFRNRKGGFYDCLM